MNVKIKASTIARIVALIVAILNQCLALFGKNVLPFTENMAYQITSFVILAIVAGINAWYNNDISKIALICGGVFDALSDKKITEEEIEHIILDAENKELEEKVKSQSEAIKIINTWLEKRKTDNK